MHSISKILTLSALVSLGLGVAMPAAGSGGMPARLSIDQGTLLTLQGISHPEIFPLSLPTPKIVFQRTLLKKKNATTPNAINFALTADFFKVALVVTRTRAIARDIVWLPTLEVRTPLPNPIFF